MMSLTVTDGYERRRPSETMTVRRLHLLFRACRDDVAIIEPTTHGGIYTYRRPQGLLLGGVPLYLDQPRCRDRLPKDHNQAVGNISQAPDILPYVVNAVVTPEQRSTTKEDATSYEAPDPG